MSLREEMWRFEKLTGRSAEHIPIIELGSYLDGVDKGIEELEKIKNELKENTKHTTALEWSNNKLQKMLNDHIKILKGENNENK